MIDKLLGQRKFVVTMTALLCATSLSAFGAMTPEFATIAIATVGAFSWANVKERESKERSNGAPVA